MSASLVARPPTVLAERLISPRVAATAAGNAALVIAGAALVALAAQVRVPLPFTPVPITGQTFGVLVVGASLGTRRATFALLLYLAAGLLGAPVFTGGAAGFAPLLGPTGGYLIGFVAAAAVLGRLSELRADRRVVTALPGMLLATTLIYAFGAAGLMIALHVDLATAVALGVVPFIVGDLIKAALAAIALPGAWATTGRLEGRRL